LLENIGGLNIPSIRESSDEDLIEELANRGIDILDIKHCTDTELNAEIDRRRKIIEKQYNDLMEGKI